MSLLSIALLSFTFLNTLYCNTVLNTIPVPVLCYTMLKYATCHCLSATNYRHYRETTRITMRKAKVPIDGRMEMSTR